MFLPFSFNELEICLATSLGFSGSNDTKDPGTLLKSIPASEQKSPVPEMEKSVFDRVKENDKKQWKNSESNETQNLADDY